MRLDKGQVDFGRKRQKLANHLALWWIWIPCSLSCYASGDHAVRSSAAIYATREGCVNLKGHILNMACFADMTESHAAPKNARGARNI